MYYGLRVSSLCPVGSLTLLASSFFSESVVVVFSSLSPPPPPPPFFYIFLYIYIFYHAFFLFSSLVYWPFRARLLACLIRAAILHFSCRLHCLHSDALSSVVLISVLLYQPAAFVFPDGSRVSEGLVRVRVSLAFRVFVVGRVIFALCSSDCSRPLLCCKQ